MTAEELDPRKGLAKPLSTYLENGPYKPPARVVTMPKEVGVPSNIYGQQGQFYHDPNTGTFYDRSGVDTGVQDAVYRPKPGDVGIKPELLSTANSTAKSTSAKPFTPPSAASAQLAKPLSVMEAPPEPGAPAPLVRPAMQIEAPAPQMPIKQASTLPARAQSFTGSIQSPNERELQRLTVGPEARTGAEQIHNKPLRILGRIGAGLLDTLLPAASISVPGTALHHELLTHQATQRVQNEDELANNETKRHLEESQAAEHEAMPDIKRQLADTAQGRVDALGEANRIREELGASKNELTKSQLASRESQARRKMGLKLDQITGAEVPITREEMTPAEQSHLDLTEANTKLKEAQEARARAQATNDPERIRIADENLKLRAVAVQNALANTGLRREHLDLLRGGQDESNAAPGQAVIDGKTVGTAFQKRIDPTNASISMAERVGPVQDLDRRIRAALQHPEIANATGPIAGRLSKIKEKYGDLPRELAELQTDLKSYGAFQAGLHPVRGIGAMRYFDEVMGGLGQTPEQLLGKLDSNLKTAQSVKESGTRNVGKAGNQGATPARPAGVPENAVYNPQTKRWREP